MPIQQTLLLGLCLIHSVLALDLTLLDARTHKPIRNVEVKVWSDNGIRCIKAPCPTNGREWKGRTNGGGTVTVPANMIDAETSIDLPGYKSVQLPSAAKKVQKWTVKVMPDK